MYAYAEFDAPQTQEAELWVGSDEGMKVWINGEMVYEHECRRRHRLPNKRPMVHIRAGKNSVLVRADQGRSRYDFSLNICEVEKDPRYDGNRVWGLQFNLPTGSTPASGNADMPFHRNTSGLYASQHLSDHSDDTCTVLLSSNPPGSMEQTSFFPFFQNLKTESEESE